MKTAFLSTLVSLLGLGVLSAQAPLPDSCKLSFGVNLSGIYDWMTEMPFVDVMHQAREWYTKDIGNVDDPWLWDSQHADELAYTPDGYPTHIPQTIASSPYPQKVATVWAITDAWPEGTYHVLFDGEGLISFDLGYAVNIQQIAPNHLTFDLNSPEGGIIQMKIDSSRAVNPIRNIRVILPGHLDTYSEQPFNPVWLERLSLFHTARFMDWGRTNNWGQPSSYDWNDPTLFAWDDRAQMNHYTWATNKGVPYEMMIQLMNEHQLDGWVCAPHRASDEYLEQMALLFRENLDPGRHLYVEYSNETWNWIFGQAQWLNEFGCVQQGLPWPEGTVPYIQNFLDIWTDVFAEELDRITRVAGLFTAYQDVSNRTVLNLDPATFDAIAPTFYFGLDDTGDAALDQLGADATAADVAFWVRQHIPESFGYLLNQKTTLADSLQKPMVFYEGGQHITPHPFGVMPSYAQALLDIQRDTAMYNLYQEWFDRLRTLQEGDKPLLLNHFAFVNGRSAQYGSWGLLETLTQDTSEIYAPKYAAILENLGCANPISPTSEKALQPQVLPFPNPTADFLHLESRYAIDSYFILDVQGRIVLPAQQYTGVPIDVQPLRPGIYLLVLVNEAAGYQEVVRFVRH